MVDSLIAAGGCQEIRGRNTTGKWRLAAAEIDLVEAQFHAAQALLVDLSWPDQYLRAE